MWTASGPFDKRSAWVDLLLLANHKDEKAFGEEEITKRGDVNISLLALSARWGWSRGKVERFLAKLVSEKMITTNSTTSGTTISLVNYGKYQDCRATDDTTDGATDSTTDDTTDGKKAERKSEEREKKQKRKKKKRESKESIQEGQEVPPYISFANAQDILSPQGDTLSKAFRPPSVEDVAGYVAEKGLAYVDPERFVNFYASKGWMVGKNKMKDWRAAARGWNSRHGKTGHELPANGRGATFFDLLLEDET